MRPRPSGESPRKEYGRRHTSTASATTLACFSLNLRNASAMFFLPRYPCGHCVHVTQSACSTSCAGALFKEPGAESASTRDPSA